LYKENQGKEIVLYFQKFGYAFIIYTIRSEPEVGLGTLIQICSKDLFACAHPIQS